MILHGDCLEELKKLEANSLDSMVTDPPAGISFMGKDWDKDKGGRENWVSWMREVMQECLRVLKPGAHAFVWAIPRTSHWTATALEDAGFQIRDIVTHHFGSGFPKSLDISKAIDKAAGAEREVIGRNKNITSSKGFGENQRDDNWVPPDVKSNDPRLNITAPSTPDAKQWQGFGTALKPASEHWILCRKPCSEKTVAANVLKWGCGGINIDASRIGFQSEADKASSVPGGKVSYAGGSFGQQAGLVKDLQPKREPPSGRFPANLVLSHNPDCVEVGVKKVGSGHKKEANQRIRQGFRHGTQGESLISGASNAPDNYGTETVSAFECTEGCAVAELDRQSGVSKSPKTYVRNADGENSNSYSKGMGEKAGKESLNFGDSGGASRFFYVAKASKRERNEGCEGNGHPTVKPLKLMTYLITMITPPGGIVLDPFAGSGSTGVAAIKAGFNFLGIEREKEYVEIANKRIYHALPEYKKQYHIQSGGPS